MADWDTGIVDFAIDPMICAVSTFCTPCQLAYQLAAIQDHPVGIMDFVYMFFCMSVIMIYSFLFPFLLAGGPCCAVKVRQQIRATYGIDGGIVGDCLVCGDANGWIELGCISL
jgi:Cys-rich protein (TIGR01571 family)